MSPPGLRVTRLGSADRGVAQELFAMMARVFGEPFDRLTDAYVEALLAREAFWAVAARVGDEVVGGLTAHVLPMTRRESRELFLYDVAVREDHQRRGVGRELLRYVRAAAAEEGIEEAFVAADVEDVHALDFYRALGGEESPVAMFTFEG